MVGRGFIEVRMSRIRKHTLCECLVHDVVNLWTFEGESLSRRRKYDEMRFDLDHMCIARVQCYQIKVTPGVSLCKK